MSGIEKIEDLTKSLNSLSNVKISSTISKRITEIGASLDGLNWSGVEKVEALSTALQNMHPGDKWEIWVPSQLGYGEAGYKNPNTGAVVVKPCTTMIFEMEVVGIVEE